MSPLSAPSARPIVDLPTGPTAPATASPTPLPQYFTTLKAYGGSRGDYVTAIAISASDWGSVLAGYDIGISAAEYDGYLVKLDKCGEMEWSKSYGGPLVDSISDVTMSQDGSIVFVGDWTPPNSIHSEILLGQVDSITGELTRVVSYSVIGEGTLRGYGLILTDDGSVLVIGTATTSSRTRALVLLLDASGIVVWFYALGGDMATRSYFYKDVTRLTSGDYVLVGHGLVDNKLVGVVSRVSANGERRRTFQWGVKGFDKAYLVARCRDGGYVIAAASRDYTPTDAITVLRFDSKNGLLWSVSIGGSGVDVPSKVIVTHDDGLLLVGSTTSYGTGTGPGHRMGCVIKLNVTGRMEWARGYGSGGYNRDYLYDVVELPGAGYRAVGNGLSNRAGAFMDAFLAQISAEGHLGDDSLLTDMTSVLREQSIEVVLVDVSAPMAYVDGIGADVTSSLTVKAISRQRKSFVQSPCQPSSYAYSAWPTEVPSAAEVTAPPSASSHPTSSCPTTSIPSVQPTTALPTSSLPTVAPSAPSSKPTPVPSHLPGNPTPQPTAMPSSTPSQPPTHRPTSHPTVQPSARPTSDATVHPTSSPTAHSPTTNPTALPRSGHPSLPPSCRPTRDPTVSPTHPPSCFPTLFPTRGGAPTDTPTAWPSISPGGDSSARSFGENSISVRSAIILATLAIALMFSARSFARWYVDDPHYTYASMCMAVGSFTTRTVLRNVESHNTKTAPGNNVIAREYVYAESGESQMVYFVRVEGTSQQDPARAMGSSSDDMCMLCSERGCVDKQGGVPGGGAMGEEGVVSEGGDVEALRQWDESSGDDDTYCYRNSLFVACGGSRSHDDGSSSDDLSSSQEFNRVGQCDADWMTDGTKSDGLESSGGGSSHPTLSAEPPTILDDPGGEMMGGWGGMSGNGSRTAHGMDAWGVSPWLGSVSRHSSGGSSSSDSSLSDLDAQVHVRGGEDGLEGRDESNAVIGRRRDFFEVSSDSESA